MPTFVDVTKKPKVYKAWKNTTGRVIRRYIPNANMEVVVPINFWVVFDPENRSDYRVLTQARMLELFEQA